MIRRHVVFGVASKVKSGRVLGPEVAEFARGNQQAGAFGAVMAVAYVCLSSQPEHRPHSVQHHRSPIFRASLLLVHTYTLSAKSIQRLVTPTPQLLRAAHPLFQSAKQLPPASRRGCPRRSCQLFSISARAFTPNHHDCARLNAG